MDALRSPSPPPARSRLGQRADGRVRHPFEGVVTLLALLIVPAMFILETRTSHSLRDVGDTLVWVTWVALALDLAVVFAVAGRRRAALRAHWLEVVVVVAAAPVAPLLLPGARFVRLLRFIRVGQLTAVALRVVSGERRRAARARLWNIGLLTGLLVATASLAVAALDARDFPSVWRGLWWAIVTATTVGYGDYTPHNLAGRLIAVVLMLLGIGFLSMLTATIAARFVAEDVEAEHHVASPEPDVLASLRDIAARLEAIERRLEG